MVDEAEQPARASPSARILVVDDESPIVLVASEVLRHHGYEAVGVTGPQRALEEPIELYDVVVTDYRMPQIDGIALLHQLRSRHPGLVGVLMTGYGSLQLVRTAMRSGFNAILLKPFPLDRLTGAIERALRQQRLADENRRLEAILDVYATGQELSRPRSRSDLAAMLAQTACDGAGATDAAVLLADPPDRHLRLAATAGRGDAADRFAALSGLGLEAAREGLARDGLTCPTEGVPLTYAETVEGLLVVERPTPFDALDLERLHLLAGQGALGLSHLRLFEERLRDEKLALVGRIAGAICQRVRAPVQRIRGSAARIDTDEVDYVDMITENVTRLEVMTGELSDFVTGQDSLTLSPCSIRALLDEVARRHAPAAANAGVRIVVEAADDALLEVDDRKMSRALDNLVKNGVEAMPNGGELRLSLVSDPFGAMIEVADTGCGMTAEVQAHVFDPFFSHGKPGGTGLGGAVVRSAVLAHGGDIELRSAVGQGTLFRIRLPARMTLTEA